MIPCVSACSAPCRYTTNGRSNPRPTSNDTLLQAVLCGMRAARAISWERCCRTPTLGGLNHLLRMRLFVAVALVAVSISACREGKASARADSAHAITNGSVDSLPPWGTNGIPVMQEPSLTGNVDPRASIEEYRFVWDRSFHRMIAIRIGRDHEHAYLIKFVGPPKDSSAAGRRDSVGLSARRVGRTYRITFAGGVLAISSARCFP